MLARQALYFLSQSTSPAPTSWCSPHCFSMTKSLIGALVRQVRMGEGTVLGQLAIYDKVVLANPVDHFFGLSAVRVAFLPSLCRKQGCLGRMPCFNTGNLAQSSMDPERQFLACQ
jgi:hypothetical protein